MGHFAKKKRGFAHILPRVKIKCEKYLFSPQKCENNTEATRLAHILPRNNGGSIPHRKVSENGRLITRYSGL